jgi:hypothetical protein
VPVLKLEDGDVPVVEMYSKETTLADVGITKTREARILKVIAES